MNAVSDLFFDSQELLTDREKALMTDILRQLLHDMEMSVRRELAERLAKTENVPHELIITLANDKIEVAYPTVGANSRTRRRRVDGVKTRQQRRVKTGNGPGYGTSHGPRVE